MNIRLTILMAAVMIFVACSADHNVTKLEESVMQSISDGAYLLSKVTITENGETTVMLRDQIKIYTKGRFMFAFDNESTGDMDVGAGKAAWVDGVMLEEPLVNHDGPLSGLSFDITIEPTETGFDQVLHGMKYDDGRVLETMVEVWDRAAGKPSPFDGLWVLEKRQTDNPELTEFTETKMIGGGHYIILQSAVFKGEKVRNFGFGTFDVKDDGKVLETGMVGSWAGYSDWATEVSFKMLDDNHMIQTFKAGTRTISQAYTRM